MAGHDHDYERLEVGGNADVPYFVNGLGGRSVRSFGTVVPESVARYTGDYGAMLVTAQDGSINFRFFSVGNVEQDSYTVNKTCM